MWFAYIDESKDNNSFFIYTALVIDGEKWTAAFQKTKAFRNRLKSDYGIGLNVELHAWKFAAGKQAISDRPILKPERAEIFREVMKFIADSGAFVVVSSCNVVEQYAFERLLNRINRTAEVRNSNVLLFFDQGAEGEITKRVRRMRVYNPVNSKFGVWSDNNQKSKSIPLSRCIEDPVFKDSSASYFIQLADFCAYALLRQERPVPSRTALGYHTMYQELKSVSRKFTNPNDPSGLGIIR